MGTGKVKDHIPNAVTLLNLVCGSVSVILALSGDIISASLFILLAAIFDFADGLLARILDARSDIGVQLDSLADVISFGLAPAILMFSLLSNSGGITWLSVAGQPVLPYVALLLVISAAYRLALFNNDPGQQYRFKGLPTPASGLFIASLPLIINQYRETDFLVGLIGNRSTLLIIIVLFSWLMISKLSLVSLKFKNFKRKENMARYILIGLSPVLAVIFKWLAIPILILLYIIISFFDREPVSEKKAAH